MHDIRMIRENPEAFDAGLGRRGISALSSSINYSAVAAKPFGNFRFRCHTAYFAFVPARV